MQTNATQLISLFEGQHF